MMRTFYLLLCCIFSTAGVQAAQTCKPDSIPSSTPDNQLVDNGDGTVTDSKTGLMWKKCLEGRFGNNCENRFFGDFTFTWQEALQQPNIVNSSGGFAGHTDWRLPNINELVSIVEEQCSSPAINLNRFPMGGGGEPEFVWSGSPHGLWNYAWSVDFTGNGSSSPNDRFTADSYPAVRLVRGGY